MDFIFKYGHYFLSLIAVSAMLMYLSSSLTSINEVESYVDKRNTQDKLAQDYSLIAPYDYKAVGNISKQEALELIFTRTSDLTPVFVYYGSTLKYFVSTKPGEVVNSAVASDDDESAEGLMELGNHAIGRYVDIPRNLKTEVLPSYKALSDLMGPDSYEWYVDVDPLNRGDYSLILVRRL